MQCTNPKTTLLAHWKLWCVINLNFSQHKSASRLWETKPPEVTKCTYPMWATMWRAVVDPVFTFVAAPSTSTRGLATMVLILAFVLSIVIARLTAHIVIPVLINVAPAMIRSLVYGSAPQIIATREDWFIHQNKTHKTQHRFPSSLQRRGLNSRPLPKLSIPPLISDHATEWPQLCGPQASRTAGKPSTSELHY